MRLFKKGTEKPIEIFVALFIILAVAMLLLKMMREQTEGSREQLQDAQSQQQMEDYTQSAQKTCNDLCNHARDAGCSLKSVARFCLAKYHGALRGVDTVGFDINKNYEIDEDYVMDAGFAVCESNIYCSQMTEPSCSCKGGLDMERCLEVLCEYYADAGFSTADANAQINENIKWGDDCDPPTGTDIAWYDAPGINIVNPCP